MFSKHRGAFKRQPAQNLNYWQASGKFSVIYQNKANNAYFDWENRDREFVIHLHGPLGQGSVYLEKHNGRYTLKDGKQAYTRSSPEALLYSQLGIRFPVSDLIYWIRGIRAPGAYKRSKNSTLYQKGWKIEYPKRERHQGYLLPEKLVATRKELKLTVIIKNWDINE